MMNNNSFTISLFKHKRDTTPQRVERSWEQLCSNFQNPLVRHEKDGMLFSPAKFEPTYRRKENVRELSLLCFDVDHNADFESTKSCFDRLGCAYVIYSTHSHLRQTESNLNAEPRYRVVVPLTCPIQANEFPKLWQFAKDQTHMPFDESAKDSSRMFYTPVKANQDAPYEFFINEGEFLDWRTLSLDAIKNGEETFNAKNASGSNQNNGEQNSNWIDFAYHDDRHAELCRRIATSGKATGRGGFEMKCPAHNGNGDTSLFYDEVKKSVACLKKPMPCSYFEILRSFNLPNGKLPSREHHEQQTADFENSETKIKPFPIPSEKCFYGLAGDFIRLVEPHTEANIMALLAQFLVYFGNIVGRTAHFKAEGDKHYTNLFCILIGNTASGRKGTSWGRVKQVFEGIDVYHEKECLASGLASGEGLLYRVRDVQYTQKKNKDTGEIEDVLFDSGVSDKRLLTSEGEFAQVLRVQGREGNTLSTYIRNLWDNGSAQSMTKNSPLKTTDAHVSIIGHITKDELLITLTDVESANGYANRFLFIAVDRAKFLPFGSDFSNVEIGRLQDKISEAIEFAKQKGTMNFSSEASKLWAAVYERLETSRFGYLAKLTQRASPYVRRLSLIYALLDKSPMIEKSHLEAALAVWQYSEDSARYIFGERLNNQTAEKILGELKERASEGMTRSEIRNLFDRHISNEKLNAALAVLHENKLAKPHKQETKGRSKEVWFSCVISDKSVFRTESVSDEAVLSAYSANNADEIKNMQTDLCPDCDRELDLTPNGQEFCEICLYIKPNR